MLLGIHSGSEGSGAGQRRRAPLAPNSCHQNSALQGQTSGAVPRWLSGAVAVGQPGLPTQYPRDGGGSWAQPHTGERGGFPVGSGDFLPNPLKFLSFAMYLNEAALKHF